MDKETRNRIQRATQAARGLLEQDFEDQLAGVFDIRLDGTIAGEPGSHLDAVQRIVRTKLVAAVEHFRASGQTAAEAVVSYRRETAFTTLNRFVALKMLEARGLMQECISRGEQSSGFKEFCGLAPGLVQLPDRGYRLYIESLFDELSVQIRVLFNRRDAGSLLWPKRATIDAFLVGLNAPELAGIWRDDETIGWIYQYYNDEAERKRMREESSAPRNSRELAVRNQFFTPRYVVEFLTDNTLGRLWYEMIRGQTRLTEQCRYLVRRPTEIFLEPGEFAPEGAAGSVEKASDALSQEELLRQPIHIPHRPLKDPRDIRLLDPACGSMHFGLYAFDLFEVIYAEAWDIAQGPDDLAKATKAFAPFVTFVGGLTDQAAFLREVPHLIVEHNLHGIDIDRRAVQIAGLSLWLRAQRAWHQGDVKPADRPRITRSNLVCAEPMPGEKELLREFVEQQFPASERSAFAFLLEKVFDRMTLAGEAGSLLRIEEEIRGAIAEARALAQRQAAPRQFQLSLGDELPEQTELNLPGLNDEQFWQAAEQRIYDALRAYAEQAENGSGFRRRLFADDAAQGFAFIDLCRKRYDVVVMNPPFGDRVFSCEELFKDEYGDGKLDLYHYFFERADTFLIHGGRVGAITPRTLLYQAHYVALREKWLENQFRPQAFAELDLGVLDAATVRPVLVVLGESLDIGRTFYKNLKHSADPGSDLLGSVSHLSQGKLDRGSTYHHIARFVDMPGKRISLWATDNILNSFGRYETLDPALGKVTEGLSNEDDARFLRCWWETPSDFSSRWRPLGKFDSRSTFVSDFSIQIDWSPSAYVALGVMGNRRANEAYYFTAGIAFTRSCEVGMAATTLPSGVVFAGVSRYFLPITEPKLGLLAYLNTRLVEGLHLVLTPDRDRISGTLRKVPVLVGRSTLKDLAPLARTLWERKMTWLVSTDETHRQFVALSPTVAWRDYRTRDADAGALRSEIYALENTIEDMVKSAVSLTEEDLLILADEVKERAGERDLVTWNQDLTTCKGAAAGLFAFGIGSVFGRWDVRYTTGELTAPELPDPFAPLPVCPPGMFQGDDGLPLSPEMGRRLRTDGLYPLDVAWDGILADDPEHPLDIERRVHDALAVIWGDRTDAIQQDACGLLGVPTLRDWFRRPAGFFADHLKRYSKSRRQAPIYWPLSSPGGRYTLWLYYHRFSRDTLYRALEQIKEKVNYEERRLQRLTGDAGSNPGAAERAALADQQSFVTELRSFHEELAQVAPLWNPNLNDGVILNYGPLWRMIGHTPWQKAVKERWDELVVGKYDWAHLAMHLWPERVVPKCATDRSLAIAHGLEAVFWKEGDNGKWLPRTVAQTEVDRLIAERTAGAVKDALKSLLESPAPATGRGGGRQSSARAPVRRVPTVPRSGNDSPGSRPVTDSAAPDPVMLDAVKQVIAAAQGATSKSEVLAATGLSDAQWNMAITALLAAGTVTKTGAARGTRYHLSATD